MSLPDIVVIWLDGTFRESNYKSMTNEFNEHITPEASSSSLPPVVNEIDMMICNTKEDLANNGAPVITARTSAEAKEHIHFNSHKKIFFISSGSLGKGIVPEIVKEYPLIHSFYIFCFKMVDHVGWALDYEDCLQMFDHPVSLLVRLVRDISSYVIEQGRAYLSINDPMSALTCFKHSVNLENRANLRDKMKPNTKDQQPIVQPDCRARLDLLEGENGLIHQAEQALKN